MLECLERRGHWVHVRMQTHMPIWGAEYVQLCLATRRHVPPAAASQGRQRHLGQHRERCFRLRWRLHPPHLLPHRPQGCVTPTTRPGSPNQLPLATQLLISPQWQVCALTRRDTGSIQRRHQPVYSERWMCGDLQPGSSLCASAVSMCGSPCARATGYGATLGTVTALGVVTSAVQARRCTLRKNVPQSPPSAPANWFRRLWCRALHP